MSKYVPDYKYYLYTHTRLDTNVVFYVGIGTVCKNAGGFVNKNARAFDKIQRNRIWKGITSRTNYRVDIILTSNDRKDVQDEEIRLISLYKRIIYNEGGTLANMTTGGEGAAGMVMSEEQKIKIRNSNLGKKRSVFTRQRVKIARKGQDMSHLHVPVVQCDINYNKIAEFPSLDSARKAMGIKGASTVIIKSCKARREMTLGYRWIYKDCYEDMFEEMNTTVFESY